MYETKDKFNVVLSVITFSTCFSDHFCKWFVWCKCKIFNTRPEQHLKYLLDNLTFQIHICFVCICIGDGDLGSKADQQSQLGGSFGVHQ